MSNKMTQGFDEFYDGLELQCLNTQEVGELCFEAGAASRQAEIDSLRIKLDGANERAAMTLNHKNKMVDKMQAEIDELQKRINDALNHTINHGGYDDLTHIINILKGDSNE